MPRKPREKSSTGIYRVKLRGINGQVIFEEHEDYEKFIQTIRECKEVSQYEIYAYCLMSNHIHLLIKEGTEDLGIVFRRIGAKYVYCNDDKFLDDEERARIDDIEATSIIKKISGVESPRQVQELEKEKRDKVIKE